MTVRTRRLKIAAVVVLVLLGALGLAAYRLLRVDDIPETLEEPLDPATLVIPGAGDQPELRVSDLRGQTAFFVFVGIRSFSGEEGRALNRALNRWVLPEQTRGFIVFDAEGFGFLQAKSTEYLGRFGAEARYPMYGDFEGAFRNVFKLPRGHHGLVVIDPEGQIAMRHSGGLQTPEELDRLRTLLGASEPPDGPPVPAFSEGGLSDERCAATPCMLVFLGHPVPLSDVPWVDGGFEGDQEARWKQASTPAVRNVSLALGLELGDKANGLVIGETPGVELSAGWSQVDRAAELRAAFGLADDTTALLVLVDGKVAMRNEGIARFYELGRLSDLLGVDPGTLMAMAEANTDHAELDLVPAVAGLGAPWWDDRATAVIAGFDLGTSRSALAAAAADSIVLQIEDVVAVLDRSGVRCDEMLVDGGPAGNDWLMQRQSDLSRRRVSRRSDVGLSALGAAHLAGASAGIFDPDLPLTAVESSVTFEPRLDPSIATARLERWHQAVDRARFRPVAPTVERRSHEPSTPSTTPANQGSIR